MTPVPESEPRALGPHWPEPLLCDKCQTMTRYVVGGWHFCVSPRCDRRGKSWTALDRWFFEAAKLAMGLKP